MPSAENCTACRFHQEIDQGTQNALAFCPPKVSDAVSLTAYLLYQMKFRLSRTFSKLFFEVFEAILSKLKLFWSPSLSKQLIYYIKLKSVCQELFSFFSSRFSAWPPRLSATALIEYHSTPPPVNKNFQVFSYFLKLVVFCFLCYNKYRTLRTKPQRCLYLP